MAAKTATLLLRCNRLSAITTAATLRTISATPSLSQEPQLQEAPVMSAVPLPPKPSTGSPFYHENWRNPAPPPGVVDRSLVPSGPTAFAGAATAFPSLDAASLMATFADLMTSQQWSELKQHFEHWIRSLDAGGKPNRPDVQLFNHYLRANLMMGSTAGELLDLVGQMAEYRIEPNAASYNLVLKAMYEAQETEAAQKLIDRMLQTGPTPDDESYNLVIGLLVVRNQIDSALKYMDLILKSGYMVSSNVFMDCVRGCVNAGRLDTLAAIIEKCKTTEQNKALCPSWNLCSYIADVALQADHSKLVYFSLEIFARWIIRGENAKPPVKLSLDEGLIASALGTAGRTYNSTLIEVAWPILRCSVRQKRIANPETYLAKIYAYAQLGNLQRAFSTLSEFEAAYGNSDNVDSDLFSPFTSLQPLVLACCKNGFSTLDSVYLQLENLSQADPPYRSVAALNCVILGCANIWDLDRAYETFEIDEASKVFEHMVSLGVKPNATTYALLVDAHLVNRDPKTSLSVIEEMVEAGFTPSKESLRKVRRRCSRELDFDSDARLQSLAKRLDIRQLGSEFRREMLYNLKYSANY